MCVCVWSYSSVQRSDGLQVASLSELHVPDLGEVEDDAPMRFQAATERVNFNTSAEHFLKELFRAFPPPPLEYGLSKVGAHHLHYNLLLNSMTGK